MDTSSEVTGKEQEEVGMTQREAFQRLHEWVKKHGKALTGISAVEAVREARETC